MTYVLHDVFKYVNKKYPPPSDSDQDIISVRWISIVVGLLERGLVATMIGYGVPGTAAFIGVWIATKVLYGQGRGMKDTKHVKVRASCQLINSLVSMIFAVIGGIWLKEVVS